MLACSAASERAGGCCSGSGGGVGIGGVGIGAVAGGLGCAACAFGLGVAGRGAAGGALLRNVWRALFSVIMKMKFGFSAPVISRATSGPSRFRACLVLRRPGSARLFRP